MATDKAGVGIQRAFSHPDRNWTKLHNDWLRDPRLDWGAVGILGFLHSHDDGWIVKLSDLTDARESGRFKVEQWIAQLELYGYLERQIVNAGRKRLGTRWLLFDPRANATEQH